ncbi:myo-inositol-1(or 4)-monophosphatase [Leucobacter luti]|uniref:inositol monophosphatase family protein n=1 Tax=Leucobacter luti TaxID=340320 RepID=UPI001044C6F5|nr:inositol monophosphatase family protein [Leucobacter luti]MCW2287262.1 myo-inositol-1(or 4)-monophosphatase [Leucobacter luti]TCK41485.1 myo-inositol-1(or 4)-monophosphatase [Leucobacter luti]
MTDTHALDASPAELARIAADIAVAVGTRIMELRELGVSVAASKSSITDVVTAADREAEQLVVTALQGARPHDAILGEEGTGIAGTSGITWVIDPIDGTVNYLYNIPMYAVSIAATVADTTAMADGRRAIAGAVYCPRLAELYEAWESGGARLNGAPLTISGKSDLETALVGTGFGYTVERRIEQAAMVSRILPRIRDIRRSGSAAYDLCAYAAGRLDAFFERGLQPWDYAAAALILRESGGALLGRDDSTPPGEPLLFAAAPSLVHELRSVVLGLPSE